MHNDCGDTAKMGCCHLRSTIYNHPQVPATVPPIQIQWTIIAIVAPLFTLQQGYSTALFKAPDEHSPPGLLIVKTTNLRV